MSFVYLFVSFLSAIFTEEEEKMLKEVKKVPWKDCLFQKNWKTNLSWLINVRKRTPFKVTYTKTNFLTIINCNFKK